MRWLFPLLILGVTYPASAKNEFLQRALKDLRECGDVDDPVCRGVPGRLAGYGKKAVRPIQKVYGALSPAGQLLALLALKGIEHKSSTKMLTKVAIKSPHMARSLAITALGERTGRSVDRALIKVLSDPNASLRAEAAEALGKHKRKRRQKAVCKALVYACGDDNDEVIVKAVESLGLLGCKKGVTSMLNALEHRRIRVRQAGLFGLRFLGDKTAVPKVMEALRDEDDRVVGDAAKTLNRLTGESFGTDYPLWKEWWDAK